MQRQHSKRQKLDGYEIANVDYLSVFMVLCHHYQIGISVYYSSFFRMLPLVSKSLFKFMGPFFPFYRGIYDFSAVFIQYHYFYQDNQNYVEYKPSKILLNWRRLLDDSDDRIYSVIKDKMVATLPARYVYSLNRDVDV